MTTEHTYISEAGARIVRRSYVLQGRAVSLIAYDPARNCYVFDTLD